MERIAFLVSGRVQGVWFRASTREAAQQFGVTGWVRNRPDGGVDGEAQGAPEALAGFREFLGRGPAHAQIENVDVEGRPLVENEPAFEVRRG